MILALDPGPTQTAWVRYRDGMLDGFAKQPNDEVLALIETERAFGPAKSLAVEMIASYGRPVGVEVFETCVWIGRFVQAWDGPHRLVKRLEVKLHVTKGGNANDAVVRQALIDKFGPGKDVAVGRKASPGPLYGVSGDVWAALGVAVTADETVV
jgi:hypothetical protein